MKNIAILQVKDKVDYKFMGYDYAQFKIRLSDYDLVWVEQVEDDDLEAIFKRFNIDARPETFKGHSLSVSDIVIREEGAYYCDRFGWKKI